jgi:hypothetical protein
MKSDALERIAGALRVNAEVVGVPARRVNPMTPAPLNAAQQAAEAKRARKAAKVRK